MKRILYSIIFFFLSATLQAQQAIDTWRAHLSYHNVTKTASAGQLTYAIGNGGLFSYNKEDNSVRAYSKQHPLNDTDISLIGYQSSNRTLLIIYSNANIDLLINDEDVYNLPELMNKTMTQDKTVNHIYFYHEYAYLSTAFGIVKINVKKREFSETYFLNKQVNASKIESNTLFIATTEGVFSGAISSNLADQGNWKKVSDDVIFSFDESDDEIDESILSVIPNSPIRNYPYSMVFAGERLLIAGGGHIADRLNRQGTVMSFEKDTWNSFQEQGISEQTHQPYKDINCVAQDPQDDTHHFAASAGEGIYEFKDGKFVHWYSMHNSPLETALPGDGAEHNYVRINGLIYDKDNNLWMVNCEATHAIHALKPDGEWISFYYPEITKASNFGRTIFDKRGWLWATSSRIESGGVFCLNSNKTIEDTSDDQCKFIERFTNQEGILLPQLAVYCIAEDKEGAIWIGTNRGPLIFNNPSKFFDAAFKCTQPKVPRNDGSDLADYLLSNDVINAIAVDGANRKWIGTEANGVYLLSADGKETIHHFTAENSALLSNSIASIALHPRTGEVYIGTSKGLVSYQSDATEAETGFKEDAIYAYPNPVKPEYGGVITVTGLVYDSDVKITDTAGHLIYKGASLGGQFTWDGCNRQGRRVASGIYFVLAADAEGKEGIVTKILFIK